MIELYKQLKTKTTTKKHMQLVIVSIGVDLVVKTDDEIYFLSVVSKKV